VRGVHLGATENLNHITRLIGDWLLTPGGSHLRTFSIDKYTYVVTHATYIINNILDTLLVGVSCIHSHHIHSCLKETSDEILITSSVAYASYNFCLLHVIFPSFCGAKVQKKA
jgi:hypothetical protein